MPELLQFSTLQKSIVLFWPEPTGRVDAVTPAIAVKNRIHAFLRCRRHSAYGLTTLELGLPGEPALRLGVVKLSGVLVVAVVRLGGLGAPLNPVLPIGPVGPPPPPPPPPTPPVTAVS